MDMFQLQFPGTSYKTVIQTIDSEGKELFKNYLSTTSVIDTAISNDNKYLAMAEANFSGILIQSTIKIISIDEAQTNSADSIKYTNIADANDLIIDIEYNNKNDLICMYDTHIDLFNKDGNKELVDLNNNVTLYADINTVSNLIQIIKDEQGKAKLQIIDSNNTESKKDYQIGSTPRQLYIYGNMIAVNLETEVEFINNNGWLVKRYKSNQEVQQIVVSEQIAGIVSNNKVKIISL